MSNKFALSEKSAMDKQTIALGHDELEVHATLCGNRLDFDYRDRHDNIVRQSISKFLKPYHIDPVKAVLWNNERCFFVNRF